MALIWGLPTEYSATVATLDAQPTLDSTHKFSILQNRQDQLNSTPDTAYPAKAQKDKKPRRHRKAKKQCFLCGAAHWVRQCTVWKDLATLARTARNSIRRPRKPKSKNTESNSTNRTTQKSDSTDSKTSKCTLKNTTDQVTRTPSVRLKGEKSVRLVQGECKARNKGEKQEEKHQEKHEDAAYRSELKEWKQFLRHQIRHQIRSAGLS